MHSVNNNSSDDLSAGYSVGGEAIELVEHVNDFFESLKIAAAKQISLKQSLANSSGTDSHRRVIDNVTAYVIKLPKYVEESCTTFHTLSAERLRVITLLSDRIEHKTTLYRINCLLISSLYWLRLYVRETICLLPYLIDVSLGLQDIHSIVSAVDAVEKLIQLGSLKQLFASATVSSFTPLLASSSFGSANTIKRLPVSGSSAALSTMYTLLLEPAASLTLSKALNGFADVRAQLTSNKLMASLQNILNANISQNTAGAWKKNHRSADEDEWSHASDDESAKMSGGNFYNKRHSDGNAKNKQNSTDAFAASCATTFQAECSALFDNEVKIARSLIDCFSQSTGFVQALSKKTLHKSISMEASIDEPGETEDTVGDLGEPNNEKPTRRPSTSKSRRSKSVIWVDAVDAGVRSRLEAAYSSWYFGRLKSAILGRCLFAMHHSPTGELDGSSLSANWSLDWRSLRRSCDLLLKILNGDVVHGPPRELLGLVLSSILLRSYELQITIVTDEISILMQEDRLTFLEKEDELAPGCRTAIGARLYRASLEIVQSGPHKLDGIPQPLYDQLFRLEASAFRSLIEFCRHFISSRSGVFLARKSYTNFVAIESEADILVPQFRSVLTNLKEFVMTTSPKEQSDTVSVDALLTLVTEVQQMNNRQRDLFVNRLVDDTTTFLTANMPLSPVNWRKKTSNQRQKLQVGPEGNSDNGYVAFSMQPHPYAFGLFRTCLNSYSSPLLASILSQDCLPTPNNFAGQLFFDIITSLFMTWLKFILDKRIKFSPMGTRQLEADFQNVQFLIEQQISSSGSGDIAHDFVTVEEKTTLLVRAFRAVPIVHQLRSVIYILLSKNADFNLSSVSSHESQVAEAYLPLPRSLSAEGEQSPAFVDEAANNRSHRRARRRNKRAGGGVAPLSSADSDMAPQSSRIYPVPFGADAWLQLIDDWPDNSNGNSGPVTTACLSQCVPRLWRRTSPTPI